MHLLAVIDATELEAPEGPATMVAGLSLVERAARLAATTGADELVIWLPADQLDSASALSGGFSGIDATILTPEHSYTAAEKPDALLILNAGAVCDRSLVQAAVESLEDTDPGAASRTSDSHLVVARPQRPKPKLSLQELGAIRSDARPRLSGGWIVYVDSPEAAGRAARRLWNSCRKAEDGIVARYLNRHLSIATSRLLAPTFVTPNHITALTFALGIAAALAAAHGEYLGFLIAGILYQLNSVIDGIDGELARVRYEFSFLGEWLDTISDDLADLLIYIGLGIGAWRTMADAPGPWGSEVWLWLGLLAAAGKVASMAVYYHWLIRHGRGDLLAFQWDFEDEDVGDTFMARLLSSTRYLFRKDFIVFAAMIASFGGYLPHLLYALAPGNIIVAISVVVQQLRGQSP